MINLQQQIRHSKHISNLYGMPDRIKSNGKIWWLNSGGRMCFYKCLNPKSKWKGDQFLIRGNKSFTPYWAMSEEGMNEVKETASKIGRNRMIKDWS